jgi:uncharacterized protein YcbK (DUF882 family)
MTPGARRVPPPTRMCGTMTPAPSLLERRFFLRRFAQFAALGAAAPAVMPVLASLPGARSLAFDHTHTSERLSVVYAVGDQYVPDALGTLNRFLRDHYTGDVGVIDPQLFDLLHRVRTQLGAGEPFQVISGYRCPGTNATLKATRGGGVATRSLHMDGKAIDVRLPGVALGDLRDVALSLRAGGVGYYPRDQFVHLDTGRVRSW